MKVKNTSVTRKLILPLLLVASVAVILIVSACQRQSQTVSLAELSPIVAEGSRAYELFQNHCAACHGRQGRGDGSAAIALNTVPRDFWNEPFRYISTMDGVPTKEDLAFTIGSGRVHGEMPSGPWLSDEDISALSDFVLELNRLGWAERLREEFASEGMDESEIQEISQERVTSEEPIIVPRPGPVFLPNMQQGRDLYLASCAACHGSNGRGDGLDMPLDDLGRPISVRDLVSEPIQGGSDPFELFKRLRCGMPGTPMPAQSLLSDDDIWQLVYYTRYLMGQPLPTAGR